MVGKKITKEIKKKGYMEEIKKKVRRAKREGKKE